MMDEKLTALLAELKTAVAAYQAAEKRVNSWEIVLDEGDPIDWRARRALDSLYNDKSKEIKALNAAEKKVIDLAARIAALSP